MYRCCGWVHKLTTKDTSKRILPRGNLLDYKMTPDVNTAKAGISGTNLHWNQCHTRHWLPIMNHHSYRVFQNDYVDGLTVTCNELPLR
jgi:hypothetical protein